MKTENLNSIQTETRFKWIFFIPLIGLIFALYLPFGFSAIGLIEEWGFLGLFTTKGLFFISDINSPLAAHALRPLTILPQAIAYFLDPNSFYYWHILLIISFVIKGVAASLLIWQATNSKFWAIISGILILVYPADTMQLALRSLHINWGLTLLLFASALFVSAFKTPKRVTAYLTAFFSAILLLMALTMYEASFPLIIIPFLIMYAKDGAKKSLSLWYSRKVLIGFWFFSITLYLIYLMIVSSKIRGYEHLLLKDQSFSKILYSKFPKLISPGLVRSILGGWFDAIQMLIKEISWWGYIYILLVLISLFTPIYYFFKKQRNNTSLTNSIYSSDMLTRLTMVGILLTVLGYVSYLVSDSHLTISQRTFLFATPGATIFWVAFLMRISKWKRSFALFCTFLLLIAGLGAQLFQFHHYTELSERQRSLLRSLVIHLDNKLPNKDLILLDETNELNHTWMFLVGNLQYALSYLLEQPMRTIEVCAMPGKEWQSIDEHLARRGSCVEHENKWVFLAPSVVFGPNNYSSPALSNKEVLKENAIILTIKKDGSVIPASEVNHTKFNFNKDQIKRYQRILKSSNWTNHFNKLWTRIDPSIYKWHFGNWWSLDLPIRGSGWREAEWKVGQLYHHASSFKTQENASLLFNLLPKKQPYILRGQFNWILSQSIRDSIEVSLNEHPLLLQLNNDNQFEAEIPENILLSGVNTIMFHSKTDSNYFGLSLALKWVEVLPALHS